MSWPDGSFSDKCGGCSCFKDQREDDICCCALPFMCVTLTHQMSNEIHLRLPHGQVNGIHVLGHVQKQKYSGITHPYTICCNRLHNGIFLVTFFLVPKSLGGMSESIYSRSFLRSEQTNLGKVYGLALMCDQTLKTSLHFSQLWKCVHQVLMTHLNDLRFWAFNFEAQI